MPSKQDVLAEVVKGAIKFGPQVINVAKAIKSLFGRNKTGPEKLAIAKEAIKDGEAVAEAIANRDLVNGEALDVLVTEAAEIGYQIMKLEERLEAIHGLIKNLKPVAQPGPDGQP